MTRKLKTLGIAMVAVLAMSVVVASAAQAASFTGTPGAVSGKQEGKHEFKTKAGTVKCNTANFTGVAVASSPTQLVTPTYGGCLLGGAVEATVTMNECTYTLSAVTGAVTINCPAGKQIEVDLKEVNCKIDIKAQTVGTLTYTNTIGTGNIAGNKILAHINVTGIHYVLTGTKEKCGVEPGTYTDGTYTGTALFESTVAGGFVEWHA